MPNPRVLIDCGHIRNAYSGLGQVVCQYANALHKGSADFSLQFLSHPRFHDFHAAMRNIDEDVLIPKFSLRGAIMRVLNKEWTRYGYKGRGHVLRHALHRNFYQIPTTDHTPFVLTIHDMHLLHDKPRRREQAIARLQKSVHRAAALGFISNYARSVTAEHIDFGEAEQHIIYNGINKPQKPQKPQWFDDTMLPFLFSVAQIAPHKNYHILPAMMGNIPRMHLIIAGRKKKYYAPQVEDAARRENTSARILLPGAINEGEKAWLLQHCTGFVFPSLREGFGMPLVEALHYGKPVFCFDNTALPEAGGKFAFYWQNNEPEEMADLIRDNIPNPPDPSVVAARQKWAAGFSWDKNAAAYMRIYRRLLRGKP